MSKIFFFILLLFLFVGCSKQEETGTENLQGSQEPAQEAQIAPEQEEAMAQQEESKEPAEDMDRARVNPFLTQEEETALKETGAAIPISYLNLSAVLYSPQSSRAIINGQILGLGDSIDNKKVIRIEPEAVVLKDAQGEYIVRLKRIVGE